MQIAENELQTGDLIFSMDSLGFAEHVCVYVRQQKNVSYVLHAVDSEKQSGIKITRLYNPDELDLDIDNYQVVRPKDFRLAICAVIVLFNWFSKNVPYNKDSYLSLLDHLENTKDDPDKPYQRNAQYSLASSIHKIPLDEYFKLEKFVFSPHHSPLEESGFFCSEAIITAYHIAYLQLNYPVMSDKHHPMLLNAAQSTPHAILLHSNIYSNHWQPLGQLEPILPEISEEERQINKQQWKDYLEQTQIDHQQRASAEQVPPPIQQRLYSTPKKQTIDDHLSRSFTPASAHINNQQDEMKMEEKIIPHHILTPFRRAPAQQPSSSRFSCPRAPKRLNFRLEPSENPELSGASASHP